MKGFIMLVFLTGILLSGTKLAFAEDNHENNNSHHEATDSGQQNQKSTDSADTEMDHSNMSEMDHSNMSDSEMDHSNMSEIDHSNMTEEEHQKSQSHEENNDHGEGHDNHSEGVDVQVDALKGGHQHSHGGGEAIVEKPANVKVLGTFGAINLSFVLIGIWNKWFKRREE